MNCNLCPRKCNVDRSIKKGFCASGEAIRVAKAMLHFWEEPCISGENGSGAVFFSGCSLRCCFCQNYKISHDNFGADITVQQLADIFLDLQSKGAHNINLVNPTHFAGGIMQALDLVKKRLEIPVVYNCGGYENIQTIKELDGYIDIYLPDFKYADNETAKKYSKANDYFECASEAVLEMHRQVGKVVMSNNIMKKGMIIRHLVLPGNTDNSLAVIDYIADSIPAEDVLISIMSQYTPFYKSADFPEINRRLSEREYKKVLDRVYECNLEGFVQELSSAKEEYVPDFNLEGI